MSAKCFSLCGTSSSRPAIRGLRSLSTGDLSSDPLSYSPHEFLALPYRAHVNGVKSWQVELKNDIITMRRRADEQCAINSPATTTVCHVPNTFASALAGVLFHDYVDTRRHTINNIDRRQTPQRFGMNPQKFRREDADVSSSEYAITFSYQREIALPAQPCAWFSSGLVVWRS